MTWRRSRAGRIFSIGKGAGSRSSASSRSPARREARGDRVQERVVVALVQHGVVALLGRQEARFTAGHDADGKIRQRAHQHGVGMGEEILGDVVLGPDRRHERRLGDAAERAWVCAVDEVDHEARFLAVVQLVVAALQKGTA
jgi:hypothetical protein